VLKDGIAAAREEAIADPGRSSGSNEHESLITDGEGSNICSPLFFFWLVYIISIMRSYEEERRERPSKKTTYV